MYRIRRKGGGRPLSLSGKANTAPTRRRNAMVKGFVGDMKGFEERKTKEAVFVEEHKKHNHQLTRQARIARREKHKQHTVEKHQGKPPE